MSDVITSSTFTPPGYKCAPVVETFNHYEKHKGSTFDPIGKVDVFSKDKEVITELRNARCVFTLQDMSHNWDRVNEALYNIIKAGSNLITK